MPVDYVIKLIKLIKLIKQVILLIHLSTYIPTNRLNYSNDFYIYPFETVLNIHLSIHDTYQK